MLEQNYEYDLLEPAEAAGEIRGTRSDAAAARSWESRQQEEVKATLLADNNGPIWKIGNEIVTGFNPASIRFPELPENLYDRPTLLWTLDNRGAQKQKVEVSYLAGELSWKRRLCADRQSRRDRGRSRRLGDAGEQQRHGVSERAAATGGRRTESRAARKRNAKALERWSPSAAGAAAAPPFQQEAFSEYHLYTLGRRTSVINNETKQISLLDASGIPLRKGL